MKCKFCKNSVPDGSIYCNWCGERLVKERKRKDDIKVPTPRQLKSGKWNIQLRSEGESITESTAELCIAKAKAIRAGFLEKKNSIPNDTLSEAINNYIESRKNTLSPSTIRGYRIIQKNRFQKEMHMQIGDIKNWQMIVDTESSLCSVKTLKNAWGFISSVLLENKIDVPKIRLPQQIKRDLPWLDNKQVLQFCKIIEGQNFELGALMALSSLRVSELCAITQNDISKDCNQIFVRGALVPDSENHYIIKESNKNISSRRSVPVMIPRLKYLLENRNEKEEYLVPFHPNTLRKKINAICKQNGLPEVGVHGLRRSFVSLGYHLGIKEESIMKIGGWTNYQTVHKHYLKLAESDLNKDSQKMTDFYKRNEFY